MVNMEQTMCDYESVCVLLYVFVVNMYVYGMGLWIQYCNKTRQDYHAIIKSE